MITSVKLKIWTLLSHAIIIIGAGHGILFLVVIEILTFPYVTKDNFDFSFSLIENHFPVVGFTTFLGQIALLFSILNKKQVAKNVSQIFGLCLLWLSVLYFKYDASKDSYTHIAIWSTLPFAICTIMTFAGRSLKRIYNGIFGV